MNVLLTKILTILFCGQEEQNNKMKTFGMQICILKTRFFTSLIHNFFNLENKIKIKKIKYLKD